MRYQIDSLRGQISGDPATDIGDADYNTMPPGGHPRQVRALEDPRNGQRYEINMVQVHSILQQPQLKSSAGWKFWGQSYTQVREQTENVRWGPLMSDSRGTRFWLMPDGLIGAKFWCDGGNTVLTRHPMDLSKPNPIEQMDPFKSSPGGMGSLYLLIDPNGSEPTIQGGTFVNTHVTNHVIDQWGRMYLPKGIRTTNLAFGSSAGKGGLFVLDEKLTKSVVNLRFGGSDKEIFGHITLEDNILVLGGRTSSKDIILKNAVQEKHGGGQYDGWLAIIKLWPTNY